jgi:hypothetical protein
MPIVDPQRIDPYVEDVQFPVSRDKLRGVLADKAAPFEFTWAVEQLPNRDFASRDDLKEALARVT